MKRYILGRFTQEAAQKSGEAKVRAFVRALAGQSRFERAIYNEPIAENPRGDRFTYDFLVELWLADGEDIDSAAASRLARDHGIDPVASHTALAEMIVKKPGSAAVKGTFLSKRRPGLSVEEYQQHWRTRHAEIIMAQPDFFAHVRAYAQNHFVPGSFKALTGEEIPPEDRFDGSPQMWFDSPQDIHSAFSTQGYKGPIHEDEHYLVKIGYSQSFISREVLLDISRN